MNFTFDVKSGYRHTFFYREPHSVRLIWQKMHLAYRLTLIGGSQALHNTLVLLGIPPSCEFLPYPDRPVRRGTARCLRGGSFIWLKWTTVMYISDSFWVTFFSAKRWRTIKNGLDKIWDNFIPFFTVETNFQVGRQNFPYILPSKPWYLVK